MLSALFKNYFMCFSVPYNAFVRRHTSSFHMVYQLVPDKKRAEQKSDEGIVRDVIRRMIRPQ